MIAQRRIAVLACAPVALCSACGNRDVPTDVIVRSVEATTQAGGARFAVHGTAVVPDHGDDEAERLAASGMMDADDRSIVAIRWLSREADHVLITGDRAYTDQWRGPTYGNPGDWWVSLPRTRLESEMGSFPATMARPPRETLRNLLAVTHVEWAGRDHVRGIDVDRYRGIVPAAERRWPREVEIWVDARRLIRRVRTSFAPGSRKEPREACDGPTPSSCSTSASHRESPRHAPKPWEPA